MNTTSTVISQLMNNLRECVVMLNTRPCVLNRDMMEVIFKSVFDTEHQVVHHNLFEQHGRMFPHHAETMRQQMEDTLWELVDELNRCAMPSLTVEQMLQGGNNEIASLRELTMNKIHFVIDEINADPSEWSSRMDMGKRRKTRRRR